MPIRRKNVTPEQRRQVLQWLQERDSIKSVAEKAALSISSVYKIQAQEKAQSGQEHREPPAFLQEFWSRMEALLTQFFSPENSALGGVEEAGLFGSEQPSKDHECDAPPNVGQLESWGITRNDCPVYLAAWRRTHEKEWHGVCDWYVTLTCNLQEGVPFPDAYHMTYAGWLGKRWNCHYLTKIADLMKLYHPWRGRFNKKEFLREIRTPPMGGSLEPTGFPGLGTTAHEAYQRIHYGEELVKRYVGWHPLRWQRIPGPPIGLTPGLSRQEVAKSKRRYPSALQKP